MDVDRPEFEAGRIIGEGRGWGGLAKRAMTPPSRDQEENQKPETAMTFNGIGEDREFHFFSFKAVKERMAQRDAELLIFHP
jgi:hypothetical protein